MSGQANEPKCCSCLRWFRRPLTAKTQVCTHRCPEEFLVDKMAPDRTSLLRIRLYPVSCHPSNTQRFIVVFHQCLEVNSGALLEIRPWHSHPPYIQLTAHVYSHPANVHSLHLLRCLPYDRSRSSSKESSPHSAIYFFLFPFPLCCRFLKAVQQLLKSFSSSPSHHFYPFFCRSSNNLF